MTVMPLKWKVRPLLDSHEVTPYRLMVQSGLSRAVTYAIANGTHTALDSGVIDKLIPALRELTRNKGLQIGDVVEYAPSESGEA